MLVYELENVRLQMSKFKLNTEKITSWYLKFKNTEKNRTKYVEFIIT